MADVYISYVREDRDVARHLAELLQRSGLTVFFDMDALVSGNDFNKTIADALRQAKAVVVLLSANTKRSTWVQQELSSVIERENGPLVIPVLLDRQAKENWVWPLISNRQTVDLTECPEKLEDVAEKLQVALGIGGELYRPLMSRLHPRLHYRIAGIAAVIALVIAGAIWNTGSNVGADSLYSNIKSVLGSPFVSGLLGVIVGALLTRWRK